MKRKPLNPEEKVERDAHLLGYAGLAPFAAAAITAWLAVFALPAEMAAGLLRWGLGYAAVILSFMAGARWSLAMVHPELRPDRALSGLLASIAPALFAWVLLIPEGLLPFALPLSLRYALLAAAFALLLLDDLAGIRAGEGPFWYASLRKRLTAGVIGAIALIVPALLLG